MNNFHERGSSMIEVLIAMVVIAFGLLGFVGMQSQAVATQIEGYQRSQALILINDISARISLNSNNAVNYVSNNIGITSPGDCNTKVTRADKVLCEWTLLLQGSAEFEGTAKLGAMLGARACISSPGADVYLISIAWQGIRPSGAPANSCGQGAYTDENVRRTVTTVLQIPRLSS